MAVSLTTLGMAYYRAGNYEKALDTLLRSDADQQDLVPVRSPREPRLPRHDTSAARPRQGSPGQARAPAGESERIKLDTARSGRDAQAKGLLREAEELLAKPKPPGSK